MKPIKRIKNIAYKELVDIASGSTDIGEWCREVEGVYLRNERRPNVILLALERYGEGYEGAVFVTREDFDRRTEHVD